MTLDSGSPIKILHVGFPKTGTTWVQFNLRRLRFTQSTPLVFGQSAERSNSRILRSLHRLVRGLETEEDLSQIREACEHGFIISAETILGNSELSMSERISKLSLVFPYETRIVISFREFGELLVSLYQEEVKNRLYSNEGQFLGDSSVRSDHPWALPWFINKLNLHDLVESALNHFEEVVLVDSRHISQMDWLLYSIGRFVEDVEVEAESRAGESSESNVRLRMWQVKFLEHLNRAIIWMSPRQEKLSRYGTPLRTLPRREALGEILFRMAVLAKRVLILPVLERLRFGRRFESSRISQHAGVMREDWDLSRIKIENENGKLVIFE